MTAHRIAVRHLSRGITAGSVASSALYYLGMTDDEHIDPAATLMLAIEEMESCVRVHGSPALNRCMIRARDKAADAITVVALLRAKLEQMRAAIH